MHNQVRNASVAAAAAFLLIVPLVSGCATHHAASTVPQTSTRSKSDRTPLASDGYCTSNGSDATGQTADCYMPYAGQLAMNWDLEGNTAPYDLDDPNGVDPGGNGLLCDPNPITTTVSGAQAASVTVTTAGPYLPPCSAGQMQTVPLNVTVTTNADPTAGPFTLTVKFAAPVTLWDPSDGGGDPAEADFVMILHVGACPSTVTPAAAAAAVRRAPTSAQRTLGAPRKAASTRRSTRTGVIGNATMVYGIPQPTANAACPTPAPIPTPMPTPPAPAIQKTLYTASLASKPQLQFTDAADPVLGTLTWNVTGDTAGFNNLAFQSTTTTAPPHANSLKFDVPMATNPKDYKLHVTVTSSVTGAVSAETVVTLRVLPPFYSTSTDNALGVFESSDDGTAVIKSDASVAQDHDDGITPDFGVDDGATSATSAVRAPRAATTMTKFYNPNAPPPAFITHLSTFAKEQKAGCVALLIDDNYANNPKSGTSPGVYYFYGYCRPAVALASPATVNWIIDAYDIRGDVPYDLHQHATQTPMSCSNTGITFQTFWHVCATDYQNVAPVTGHAEAQKVRYSIALTTVPSTQQTEDPQEGTYIVNNKGVFYPLIPVNAAWGQTDNGYVPFWTDGRNPPLNWCGAGDIPLLAPPRCYNSKRNSAVLGANLQSKKPPGTPVFPKPGAGFHAHHIQPTSWGGTDEKNNGVWLPAADHYPFNHWWASRNFSV